MGANPTGLQNLVQWVQPRNYAQNKAGNVFHASTTLAAPVTLTTSGSTSMTFGLWNPAGSQMDYTPLICRLSIQGTGTQADLVWVAKYGLGSTTAGTSPITAANTISTIPGYLQIQTPGQSASIATSSATLGAAGTILRWWNSGWGAPATNTAAIYTVQDYFEGDVIVVPGTAIFLAATAAPGVTANVSLTWQETPH